MFVLFRILRLAIALVFIDPRLFALATRYSVWVARIPSQPGGRLLYTLSLPFRLVFFLLLWNLVLVVSVLRPLALLFALGVLIGLVELCQLPFLAASQRVQALDVALRCLDAHPLDPFHILSGGKSFQRRSQGPTSASMNVSGMVISIRDYTPEEQRRARKVLADLYPPRDRSIQEQLLHWGEVNRVQQWGSGIFVLRRSQARIDGVSENQRLLFAWQRLCADNPLAEEDLPRLADLVRQAYPAEEESAAALAWAQVLYDRLRANAEQYQALIHGGDALLPTVLPPLTEGTLWWLLYQYVGLTDASRGVDRERWLSYFPANRTEEVLDWGRQLVKERRTAGEPLPPSSDNVALLCAIDRLTGTDAYGDRCRRIVTEAVGSSWLRGPLLGSITFAYPNDDLLYLAAAGDPLALLSPQPDNFFEMLSHLVLVCWGLRMWVFQVLGHPLRRNPSFLRFRNRELRHWKETVLVYTLVILALWPAAWLTLSPPLRLFVSSPGQLLVGVCAAVLLGGSLILFLNRLIALVLIARGYELERTWLDEILGAIVGAGVLFYFGNDLFSIAAFVAFAVVPELLQRRRFIRDLDRNR